MSYKKLLAALGEPLVVDPPMVNPNLVDPPLVNRPLLSVTSLPVLFSGQLIPERKYKNEIWRYALCSFFSYCESGREHC